MDILDLAESLSKEIESSSPLTKVFLQHVIQNAITFDRKQQDYGPSNIAEFGLAGVIVRMSDKMERLKTLAFSGHGGNFESMLDTLYDLANYAIIAAMIQENDWPEKTRWSLKL